jgi:glutamate-1-semialdehyde 2,1-aminomutase
MSQDVQDRTARTAALTGEADRVLGYGGFHRLAWQRFYSDEEDVFPRFAASANGYEIVDPDGRSFIDWVGGGGPVILGYNHPAVEEAIRAQLAVPAATTLSLMHPIELEVASLLTEIVPCAEMVAFGKNGSDAVTAAVRIARAVTGREVILHYGGHGFHDWFVSSLGVPGLPRLLGDLVHPFPYNDYDALAALFEEYAGQVAAIVMEPVNIAMPDPGYLEAVRDLAHEHGALLVFDEMVTAFRVAPGGAQELFGVEPDLAALGKGMGNGMPVSAVVGKREYMRQLPSVAYGMTFRGETLSLAAAAAVLRLVRDEAVTEHLARIGSEVRTRFEHACAQHGVIGQLIGPPARMSFAFGDDAAVPPERIETVFLRECARNGVLTNANILPSLAHDEEAVERTAAAFDEALKPVVELLVAGRFAAATAIQAGFAVRGASGTSSGTDPRLPGGCLDAAREEGGRLLVRGWMLFADDSPDAVEFVAPDGQVVTAERPKRPDVADFYGGATGAENSGFAGVLPADVFAHDDEYEFTLRAWRGGDVAFACRMLRPRNEMRSVTVRNARFADSTLYI